MTKDTCASFDIPFSAIERVTLGIDAESTGKDGTIATGAFFPPRVPTNSTSTCANSATAVDCLREISLPNSSGTVHYAAAYLPNALEFLTDKYGAEAVEALVIPSVGAVEFSLKR